MSEHPEPFSPDDARLSAYLLGEMEAEEQQAFEAELEAHPEAKQLLEGLRETSSLLSEVLDHEPTPALSKSQRSAILAAAAEVHPPNLKENLVMKNHRGTWAIVAAIATVAAAVVVFINLPEPVENDTVALKESRWTDKTSSDAKHGLDAKYAEKTPNRAPDDDWGLAKENYEEFEQSGKSRARGREEGFSNAQSDRAGLDKQTAPGEGEIINRSKNLAQLESKKQNMTPGENAENSLEYLAPAPPAQDAAPDAAAFRYSGRGGSRGGDAGSPSRVAGPNADPKSRGEQRAGGRIGNESVVLNRAQTVRPGTPNPGEPGRPGGGAARGFENNAWKESSLKSDFADAEDPEAGNESYEPIFENAFVPPRGEQALSTFSIDVDTASYSNVRRFIKHGQRPPADAVRIEELVNYFHYDYKPPINGDPFSVHTEVAICPWKPEHHLVRFGVKGREIAKEQRPLSNLVFLVDVSGSMSSQNKLPLVKKALTMLASEMGENDRISLVTYASNAAVQLPSMSGEYRSEIIGAIQNLKAGGSTNGEGGIHLAYTQAIGNFIEDGVNRVILCTDGDFNVGVSGDDELSTLIEDKAKKSGVFLSVFGFGMGNYKDSKLEKLSGKGNGNYAYIDNEREAKKVFVEELTGTLYTIAKDVKIQVEFNPAHVGAYRLIGYENRVLAAQDFNDDTKDAGEIGAGHTVTALYEVIPTDKMPAVAEGVEPLKYQPVPKAKDANAKPSPEMLTLKLRYKQPDEDVSAKREYPVKAPGKRAEASQQTEWQAAVAAFGMVLRNSKHKGQADLRLVKELAMGSRGPDPTGRRREFVDLVLTAERLANGARPIAAPEPASKEEAEKTASVKGKYKNLLKTLNAPQDLQTYGAFNDYGYWEGDSYLNQEDLPKAHWVYVYPNWYLWETAE